jgi:hypothetical protein
MGNYDPPEPEKEPFAYTAAKLGIYAPILAIVLNAGLRLHASSSTANATGLLVAKLIVPILGVAVIAAGAVFSIVALCNTSRLGKEGLLGRGISGLVSNGILLALFAVAFVHGFTQGFTRAVHARETRQELREANNDLRSSLRNSFDSEKGITNVDFKKVDDLRGKLDKAATNLGPEDARVAKVASAYLGEVQVASRALENALTRLKEAQVLQFSGVTTKEQLRSRRDVVQRYAAANDRVRAVVTNSSTFFRTELQRLGASPESIEKSTREMEQASREQNKLVLAIRNADTRMMTGMTGVLDLLENNWGKWKSNSEVVTFEDTAMARKYNALIQEIQAAGEAQISAQRKLVNLR